MKIIMVIRCHFGHPVIQAPCGWRMFATLCYVVTLFALHVALSKWFARVYFSQCPQYCGMAA